MFCDETKIKVIAGKGGDGCASFRREKYIPKGGPDGGDGGRGGNVILKSNENINTLFEINSKKLYKATSGENGKGSNKTGKTGEDLTLEVPVGTVIWNENKSKIIADLNKNNQEFILAKGGKGGLGNQHFATSINQTPTFAENGEPGQEKEVTLELKLVADVGLVGMPSVGKSTLISHVSNARPKIAAYEFTTLIPNLGVVDMQRFGGSKTNSFVIADMPGLIEGASMGKGLGHKFLKHIARTSVIIHIIDPLRENPAETFEKIQNELKTFDKSLIKKPLIVAINKIDAVTEKDLEKIELTIRPKLPKKSVKIFRISAVTGTGLKELLFESLKIVEKARATRIKESLKKPESEEIIVLHPHEKLVKFQLKKEKGKFIITGERIEQLVKMTNIKNLEGLQRIYKFMDKMGITRALRREKVKNNDIIEIADKQIQYLETL
jgi:GTP-binding protein